MKISILNRGIVIQVSGLELLKLKTEIYKRIGNIAKSSGDTIKIPFSTLPLLEDLLSLEARNLPEVRKYLRSYNDHRDARIKALDTLEKNEVRDLSQMWLSILDPAQATAVSTMVTPKLLGLCLFDEQGSGKTVMALASFDILRENNMVDALIVACPKSMVSEWPKDLEKFLPKKYKVVIGDGDKRHKYETALAPFDVLVTNYEGIDAMLTALIAVSTSRRFLLIVDESFYLKNGGSIRSENMSKLRDYCERCFVLCGTPAPNSAHDLINQFDLADLGYTFAGFSKSKDPTFDWPMISQLVEEKGLFIRRLKTDILSEVPEKNFHVIPVTLTGRQAVMYELAKSELQLILKTLDDATFKRTLITYFQRRSALLQICCCPSAIDPTLTQTPVKYLVLDELLESLTSEGRKVILWSFYRKSLDELTSRYKKYNPVRVDGSVSMTARKAAVESFQEDPSTLLFIGNPAAAGAGITLHASFDAVYVSYSNQAAHYLQSLDRIHRRGQLSDHVNYYLIACENTIETVEIARLRGKEINQHSLLGDNVAWPNSLDDALKELAAHD